MTDVQTLVLEVKSQMEQVSTKHTQLGEQIAAFSKDATEGKTISKDALKAAENAVKEVQAAVSRIVEIEQKVADNVTAGKESVNTLGGLVIASEQFKAFASGNIQKMKIEVNATLVRGGSGGNADATVEPERLNRIIPGAFRNLTVEQALPGSPISTNSLQFPRELLWTDNAAEQNGQGAAKAQSAITFELATALVQTIAHFIPVSKQVLEDSALLESYINTRMAYGVNRRVDSQLLNGTGSSNTISGLLFNGNFRPFSPTAGDTAIDSINRMIYTIQEADYVATAIMLNPRTWGEIERLKGDDDHYIFANPQSVIGPVLWGLPVVLSNHFPVGKAHIANLEVLATVLNRSGTVVEMFEQDVDNVQKNIVTIRAECRKGLAIYNPNASLYGALTSPGASA